MQIGGYTGNGLNPFITRYGAGAHAAQGLFDGPTGPTLRNGSLEAEGISDVFAQDIVSRIGSLPTREEQEAVQSPVDEPTTTPTDSSLADSEAPAATPDTATAGQELDATPETAAGESAKDPSGLQESLARAIDFVREEFGNEAATATMGLIYKRIGNNEVTEENLGRGMLDALRFIDRNFGFAAGDKVMAFFNQDVNQAMNDYFDNGLMESFYAASPGKGQAKGLQMTSAMQEVAQQYGEDAVKGLLENLESALEAGEKPGAALRQAVEQTGEQMAAQYGGDPEEHAALLGKSLSPLLHGQGMAQPPRGGQLNLMV